MLPKVPGYELSKLLGQGGEGSVYECSNGLVMKRKTCGTLDEANNALQEALNMARLGHIPQVVSIEDAFLQRHPADRDAFLLNIVMPKYARDVLQTLGFLTTQQTLKFTVDILRGLAALHKAGVIHRDIKCDNLFVSELDECLIGDLGLGQKYSMEAAQTSAAKGDLVSTDGTYFYYPPELFASASELKGQGPEGDVWAAGICLFEMLSGKPAASRQSAIGLDVHSGALTVQQLLQSIGDGAGDATSAMLKSVALLLLEPDFANRPSAAAVLETLVSDSSHVRPNNISSAAFVDSVLIRPFTQSDYRDAANVLACAFEKDPRTYYHTYLMEPEHRLDATGGLYRASVRSWVLEKPHGSIAAVLPTGQIIGVMLLCPPDSSKNFFTAKTVSSMKSMLKNKHRRALISGCTKQLADCLKEYNDYHSSEVQFGEMLVAYLGVLPMMQGRGIGRKLFQFALDWADSKQVSTGSMVFHASQTAFLSRFGFTCFKSCTDFHNLPSYYLFERLPKPLET